MNTQLILEPQQVASSIPADQPVALVLEFEVEGPIAFDVNVGLELAHGDERIRRSFADSNLDVSWLPQGRYRATWFAPRLGHTGSELRVFWNIQQKIANQWRQTDAQAFTAAVAHADSVQGDIPEGHWELETLDGGVPIDELSWRRSHEDWFFRHFDHAARTIISYMLGDSPLLQGDILDVGCGDGITDVGVALRCQPKSFVGVDPFKGFERLPDVLQENHICSEEVLSAVDFRAEDGNHLPFADNSFDVVLSWGSLEHIAGGYLQTMREIKRVLRPNGLFFVHPGLYYSNIGHHIGEFTDEPFVHLTHTPEEIHKLLMTSPPDLMDRAGDVATPEQYWQWYNELNPMTITGFEAELRALEFDLYRVAMRTQDLVEYHHPNLQNYPMQDLATTELYVTAINRKVVKQES